MYRQNAEYTIPHDADAELSVMIRHQRYVNAREHYHTVPYHDNMSVAVFKPDLQLIALRKALAKMQTANPEGYALLTNFYFENFRSVKSFAEEYGISRQAMAKKIARYLAYLRALAYDELNRLYLEN